MFIAYTNDFCNKCQAIKNIVCNIDMFTAVTIKRKITTKYRLPVLNWVAMKPNQVKGTVFSELDDEKLYNV